jgi:hypothetical protein
MAFALAAFVLSFYSSRGFAQDELMSIFDSQRNNRIQAAKQGSVACSQTSNKLEVALWFN